MSGAGAGAGMGDRESTYSVFSSSSVEDLLANLHDFPHVPTTTGLPHPSSHLSQLAFAAPPVQSSAQSHSSSRLLHSVNQTKSVPPRVALIPEHEDEHHQAYDREPDQASTSFLMPIASPSLSPSVNDISIKDSFMEPVTPMEAEGRMETEMEMRMRMVQEEEGIGGRPEAGRDEERLNGSDQYEKMDVEGNKGALGGESGRQGSRGESGQGRDWVDETKRGEEEDDDVPLDPLSLIKKHPELVTEHYDPMTNTHTIKIAYPSRSRSGSQSHQKSLSSHSQSRPRLERPLSQDTMTSGSTSPTSSSHHILSPTSTHTSHTSGFSTLSKGHHQTHSPNYALPHTPPLPQTPGIIPPASMISRRGRLPNFESLTSQEREDERSHIDSEELLHRQRLRASSSISQLRHIPDPRSMPLSPPPSTPISPEELEANRTFLRQRAESFRHEREPFHEDEQESSQALTLQDAIDSFPPTPDGSGFGGFDASRSEDQEGLERRGCGSYAEPYLHPSSSTSAPNAVDLSVNPPPSLAISVSRPDDSPSYSYSQPHSRTHSHSTSNSRSRSNSHSHSRPPSHSHSHSPSPSQSSDLRSLHSRGHASVSSLSSGDFTTRTKAESHLARALSALRSKVSRDHLRSSPSPTPKVDSSLGGLKAKGSKELLRTKDSRDGLRTRNSREDLISTNSSLDPLPSTSRLSALVGGLRSQESRERIRARHSRDALNVDFGFGQSRESAVVMPESPNTEDSYGFDLDAYGAPSPALATAPLPGPTGLGASKYDSRRSVQVANTNAGGALPPSEPDTPNAVAAVIRGLQERESSLFDLSSRDSDDEEEYEEGQQVLSRDDRKVSLLPLGRPPPRRPPPSFAPPISQPVPSAFPTSRDFIDEDEEEAVLPLPDRRPSPRSSLSGPSPSAAYSLSQSSSHLSPLSHIPSSSSSSSSSLSSAPSSIRTHHRHHQGSFVPLSPIPSQYPEDEYPTSPPYDPSSHNPYINPTHADDYDADADALRDLVPDFLDLSSSGMSQDFDRTSFFPSHTARNESCTVHMDDMQDAGFGSNSMASAGMRSSPLNPTGSKASLLSPPQMMSRDMNARSSPDDISSARLDDVVPEEDEEDGDWADPAGSPTAFYSASLMALDGPKSASPRRMKSTPELLGGRPEGRRASHQPQSASTSMSASHARGFVPPRPHQGNYAHQPPHLALAHISKGPPMHPDLKARRSDDESPLPCSGAADSNHLVNRMYNEFRMEEGGSGSGARSRPGSSKGSNEYVLAEDAFGWSSPSVQKHTVAEHDPKSKKSRLSQDWTTNSGPASPTTRHRLASTPSPLAHAHSQALGAIERNPSGSSAASTSRSTGSAAAIREIAPWATPQDASYASLRRQYVASPATARDRRESTSARPTPILSLNEGADYFSTRTPNSAGTGSSASGSPDLANVAATRRALKVGLLSEPISPPVLVRSPSQRGGISNPTGAGLEGLGSEDVHAFESPRKAPTVPLSAPATDAESRFLRRLSSSKPRPALSSKSASNLKGSTSTSASAAEMEARQKARRKAEMKELEKEVYGLLVGGGDAKKSSDRGKVKREGPSSQGSSSQSNSQDSNSQSKSTSTKATTAPSLSKASKHLHLPDDSRPSSSSASARPGTGSTIDSVSTYGIAASPMGMGFGRVLFKTGKSHPHPSQPQTPQSATIPRRPSMGSGLRGGSSRPGTQESVLSRLPSPPSAGGMMQMGAAGKSEPDLKSFFHVGDGKEKAKLQKKPGLFARKK